MYGEGGALDRQFLNLTFVDPQHHDKIKEEASPKIVILYLLDFSPEPMIA